MRGTLDTQVPLFRLVHSLETQVPLDHRLRPIRDMIDEVLGRLHGDFSELYSTTGRPSIPPERLLKALFLQVLYSIRSENQLLEHLRFNTLFRWFVGLESDEKVWDESSFSKNRERLMEGDIAHAFFAEVLEIAKSKNLVSREHFTVDGTLIEAWASQKSFQKRTEITRNPSRKNTKDDDDQDPGNPTVSFHGEKRTNDTHESTTDPEARLYKKSRGDASRLCFLGHVLMENRSGLAVLARLTSATGTAEREAALTMLDQMPATTSRCTLGGDKGYGAKEFAAKCRERNVTPHVAVQGNRRNVIDGRTTRHTGYEVSQRKRKRVEEVFGWLKTVGPMRKTHFRGTERVGWMFEFALAAYNIVRIGNLSPPGEPA